MSARNRPAQKAARSDGREVLDTVRAHAAAAAAIGPEPEPEPRLWTRRQVRDAKWRPRMSKAGPSYSP